MHSGFIHHPLFLLFFVTFLGFLLSEIRLHWTPPRRCSSSWLRKACPACRPAWGRFILTTGTQMVSYTSPTPRRRYLERLHWQPGHPADNQGDDHVNLTSSCSDSWTGRAGRKSNARVVQSRFSRPKLHLIQFYDLFCYSQVLPPLTGAQDVDCGFITVLQYCTIQPNWLLFFLKNPEKGWQLVNDSNVNNVNNVLVVSRLLSTYVLLFF